jgi:hypothetical protein
MTIAAVAGQASGTLADNTTSISLAFGSNVSVGSLVVVAATKYSPSDDAFVAGDCTKSAGTATIGTISMDVSANVNTASSNYAVTAVWSCVVTGAGSLTMQVAGAASGSYLLIGIDEYTGSWDASRLETSNTKTVAGTNSSAADSNSVTSAGAALMVAGLGLNGPGAIAITDDASFTSIYKEDSGDHMVGSFIRRIVTTGTTDTANWTLSGTNDGYAAVIAVYKEAAGGGGGGGTSGGMMTYLRNQLTRSYRPRPFAPGRGR